MMFCLLALMSTASAQVFTAEEVELRRLYDDNKLITARRIADDVMKADPDSIVGNYVLGAVYRESEGNLPKAMFHLGRARELYESRWIGQPQSDVTLHQNLLLQIEITAGELEEFEYQVQILDYYDSLYDPNLTAEHAWPLMKLGRVDDAREYATKATASRDPWQRSLGYNTLCALEGEATNRTASWDACYAALEMERKQDDADVNVDAYNASIAAKSVLKFTEAEELAKEANTGNAFSTANPWVLLTDMYLGQGRGDDAVNALSESQRWRSRQPPHLRDQSRAEGDAAFARLLLIAGESQTGMSIVDRALDFPDRQGYSSSNADQALGGHSLLRLAMRRLERQKVAENIATQGLSARTGHWLASWGPVSADWEDRAAVSAALSNRRRLDATLRMYVNGAVDAPGWMVGDLIDVLGAGVVAATLADVRTQETDIGGLQPYYDAIDAETRLHRGDEAGAVTMAQQALQYLPQTEVLLRARVAAVGAMAAYRNWDEATAIDLYEEAMQVDPGVFRRLGEPIPARVEVLQSDSWAATYAGRMLERSPRLRSSSTGFVVSVEGGGERLRTCLRTSRGTLLSCAPAPKPPPQEKDQPPLTDWEYAQYVVYVFHERAFAMPLGVSGTDLKSLDGSNVVDTEASRKQMQGLLQNLIDEK